MLPEEKLERIKEAIGDGDLWVVTSDPKVTTDPNKKIFCFIPPQRP
jgi:anti-sigma28 factor (negative regulator of flagellin synthesis)